MEIVAGCKGRLPPAQWVVQTPTMEAVDELMKRPPGASDLATGGPGMVRAAHPPQTSSLAQARALPISKSADIPKPWEHMLFRSKTFDNGTICASEQNILHIVKLPAAN